MQINTGSNPFSILGKPRRQRFGVGGFIFLFFIGLVFTAVGSFFVMGDLRSIGWPTTTGTVTDVSVRSDDDGPQYQPTVSYTVDGNTYQARESFSTSTPVQVGDTRTVAYEAAHPANGAIRTSGADLFVYIFPLIGIGVIIGAIVGVIGSKRRDAAISSLQASGTKVTGVITSVTGGSSNSGIRIVVSATDPASNTVKDYLSDVVDGNTLALIDFQKNPIPVDVFINPSNPDNYYVDISDIPELTPDKIQELIAKATSSTSHPYTLSAAPSSPTPTPEKTSEPKA